MCIYQVAAGGDDVIQRSPVPPATRAAVSKHDTRRPEEGQNIKQR